ncbi:hypothetical protein IWX47DRAFT_615296 [Phyllosticta citricarpa]
MCLLQSFFGMNINQLDPEVSSWTNQTFINPADANKILGFNVTETITRGGDQSCDLDLFWKISAPLTFVTIILPLILGGTFRWLYQSINKTRHMWRVYVAIAAFIISIQGTLWPFQAVLPTVIGFICLLGGFGGLGAVDSAGRWGWKAPCYWAFMFCLWIVITMVKGSFFTGVRGTSGLAELPRQLERLADMKDLGALVGFAYWVVILMVVWWRKPEWYPSVKKQLEGKKHHLFFRSRSHTRGRAGCAETSRAMCQGAPLEAEFEREQDRLRVVGLANVSRYVPRQLTGCMADGEKRNSGGLACRVPSGRWKADGVGCDGRWGRGYWRNWVRGRSVRRTR